MGTCHNDVSTDVEVERDLPLERFLPCSSTTSTNTGRRTTSPVKNDRHLLGPSCSQNNFAAAIGVATESVITSHDDTFPEPHQLTSRIMDHEVLHQGHQRLITGATTYQLIDLGALAGGSPIAALIREESV